MSGPELAKSVDTDFVGLAETDIERPAPAARGGRPGGRQARTPSGGRAASGGGTRKRVSSRCGARRGGRKSRRVPVVARVSCRGVRPSYWKSVNLSEGGMFVEGAPTVDKGTELDVLLWLPEEGSSSIQLTCKARVVWVHDPDEGSIRALPVGMGLQFLGLTPEARNTLANFLAQRAVSHREKARSDAIGEMIAESLENGSPHPAQEEPAGAIDCALRRPSHEQVSVITDDDDILPLDGDSPLEPGEEIGSYRIVALLGSGGMGNVYLAEHKQLGRKFAIKRLHRRFSDDASFVRRFFAEARALSQISHPNIVEVTDFISQAEHKCFVMEYLEGETLTERLTSKTVLRLPDVLRIGEQICRALETVHQAGILHRDLKPENIALIDRYGVTDHVKLLDFGVAKLVDQQTGAPIDQTVAGVSLGTPGYMAPEQILGERCDFRADIYALGVVLYQMVTGEKPFVADTWPQMVLKHATEPPRPPSIIASRRLPPELELLIMQCLEKEPARRPASVAEVRQRLVANREPDFDDVSGPLRAPASWDRRWLFVAAVAMMAGLLLIGARLVSLYPNFRAHLPMMFAPAAAETNADSAGADDQGGAEQSGGQETGTAWVNRPIGKDKGAHGQAGQAGSNRAHVEEEASSAAERVRKTKRRRGKATTKSSDGDDASLRDLFDKFDG